ncbi:MAG: hypothetical protein ACOYXT_09075 [Bacteroidota bacterium]
MKNQHGFNAMAYFNIVKLTLSMMEKIVNDHLLYSYAVDPNTTGYSYLLATL